MQSEGPGEERLQVDDEVTELFKRHFTSTGFCNLLGFRKQNRLERRVKGEGTHPT